MMRMRARGLYMKIDNLLIFLFNTVVAVSARGLGILHGKMMSVRKRFSLRCEMA